MGLSAAGALAATGLVSLVHGATSGSLFNASLGLVVLCVAVALCVQARRPRGGPGSEIIGGLAEVLAQLGAELRGANAAPRDEDTVNWAQAELELSVTVQREDSGGVAFKVANGERKRGSQRTTQLRLTLVPAGGVPTAVAGESLPGGSFGLWGSPAAQNSSSMADLEELDASIEERPDYATHAPPAQPGGSGSGTLTAQGSARSMFLWSDEWLFIAEEFAARAQEAETQAEAGDLVALTAQTHAAMVAIAAASFAIEAEANRIALDDEAVRQRQGRTNRGERIAQGLVRAHQTRPDPGLVADLKWLFEVRNASVHPKHAESGTAVHPSGLNVTPIEVNRLTAESAARAVDAVRAVHAVTRAAQDPEQPGFES